MYNLIKPVFRPSVQLGLKAEQEHFYFSSRSSPAPLLQWAPSLSSHVHRPLKKPYGTYLCEGEAWRFIFRLIPTVINHSVYSSSTLAVALATLQVYCFCLTEQPAPSEHILFFSSVAREGIVGACYISMNNAALGSHARGHLTHFLVIKLKAPGP